MPIELDAYCHDTICDVCLFWDSLECTKHLFCDELNCEICPIKFTCYTCDRLRLTPDELYTWWEWYEKL